MIYFIQAKRGGPIKIGYAREPQKRLAELQGGNPYELKIVATIEGGWVSESVLHKRFAEGRMVGEWFEASTPGLGDLIADIRTGDRYARLPWWSGVEAEAS